MTWWRSVRKRWDPNLYGPEGKCHRCGRPVIKDDEFYFSGPSGEEVHAVCEGDAVSRNPTRAGEIFLVMGKASKQTPAIDLLKISSLDLAIEEARSWLAANGVSGEGSAKVFDVYDQSTAYEVGIDADGKLIVVRPSKQTLRG